MNKDIRVAISFFNHRKTRRLHSKYGEAGVLGLLRIWAYAAESRSSGYLTDMTDEDIALEAQHTGNASEFVAFLIDPCKWIDRTENGLYLHDWHIHQKIQKRWYSPRVIQNSLMRKLRPYKIWRKSVLSRDGNQCRNCGFISKSNHAHHIKPWARNIELRYEVGNGMTLCRECHVALHKIEVVFPIKQER